MKGRDLSSVLLFTIVSIASFSIWAFGSSFFSYEPILFLTCAVVFLILGGFSIAGTEIEWKTSYFRRVCTFALAFSLYSVIWSIFWFILPETLGEVIGSSLGLFFFALLMKLGCKLNLSIFLATSVIFFFHTIGYYIGGFAYAAIQGRGTYGINLDWEPAAIRTVACLLWGLCYGLGFGIGINRFLYLSRQSSESPSTQI